MKIKNLFNRDAWQRRITLLFSSFFTRNFVKTYYYHSQQTWTNTSWMGVQILKAPTDLWVYQELIVKCKPDFIVETGTYKGGSALYFATICDFLKHGKIITVDIHPCETEHPRITKIVDPKGSTAPHVVKKVKELIGNSSCLVILDSTHRHRHVMDELECYSSLVSVGGYLIVEDTCLGGHPVLPAWGDGPMDAVEEFTKKRNFISDRSMEKLLLTLHPKGFLKRIR